MLDPTMDVPPIDIMPRSTKGNEFFRTRYWFPLFYFLVLLGFATFFFLAQFPRPSIGLSIAALVLACLLGVRWYFSLKKIKEKFSLR